jgi:glycosyltransferase involved in cell wall biosynthesis
MRSVTIFCPDSHVAYNRATLDKKGLGGGATARVRMAFALARQGHPVRLYINCLREGVECGVETHRFSALKQDRSEVFIASTSGGQLDLTCLKNIETGNALKILLVHGVTRPKGLEGFPFDYVYAPSNFIRRIINSEWDFPKERIFVSHRGVQEQNFRRSRQATRDPFALIYAGHPSKGLETAIAILRFLRAADQRFHLHVYGGAGLWGGTEENPKPEVGISFHGIIGQRRLSREIQHCSFCINLQHRQEPFGMVVIEAMRAGCIVLASPVGAYPEIITHGQDGFLVPGDPFGEPTRRAAAGLILALVRSPEYAGFLRRNAIQTPLTWDQVARTWEGHWEWALTGTDQEPPPPGPVIARCDECQGACLPLADGLHCTRCGNYQRKSSPPDPT